MAVADDDVPGSAITSIKSEVARSLEHADTQVRVHATEYFNNTFAPDLVLQWPREKEERFVYLRTSADVRLLIEDVNLIDDASSIVMPLTDIETSQVVQSELHFASRTKRSLITQPRSFRSLGDLRAEQPVSSLASRSLLQGGYGYVQPEEAIGFGESLATGFEAAQGADGEATSVAVQRAEDLLDPARAAEVNSFLHAVWVGSGAPGSAFPGSTGAAAAPTGAALDLLLRTVVVDDQEFWDRLARSLSFAKLAEMSATVDDNNFQLLMRASADRLQAKAMRIVEGAPATTFDARWFLRNGKLGLRFGDLTAMFRATGDDFDSSGISTPTTMTQLQRRADRANLTLTDITVGTNQRRLDYGSEDGGEITKDDQLAQFESALGVEAQVRRASARIGPRDLIADFSKSTAAGRTAATFRLSELIEHLPLFADYDRGEISHLQLTALGQRGDAE